MKSSIFAVLCALGVLFAAPSALAQKAAAATGSEAPPLEKLPDWAVPQSYKLELRSDPEQPGYSGTVMIAVDLKKSSDHLWLHGKDLKVSNVTVIDANGKSHEGKYVQADADAGVA